MPMAKVYSYVNSLMGILTIELVVIWDGLKDYLVSMSGWEVAAVLLALLYLVLAVRQIIWCWLAAFASTSIYLFLFYSVQLPSESLLQLFYMAMAVYGWWQWSRGGADHSPLQVSTWSWRRHSVALVGIGCGTAFLAWFFITYTQPALPYEDAFTTSGAIVATYMTTKKILENWYYWFVIDSISIHLYFNRGLYLTAALFVLYLVIIVFGFLRWRADLFANSRQVT